MNCQEAREKASDYLDQRVAPGETALLEGHLRGCQDCRRELEALRRTIALTGSLNPIETSPDFLSGIQRKIERKKIGARLRTWLFEPMKIKLPAEVTALLLIGITVLYLYSRAPEPAREMTAPASPESYQIVENKPRAAAPAGVAQGQEGYRMAEKSEALAKLPAQPAPRRESREDKEAVASAPTPQLFEVAAEDTGLYRQRVERLLAGIGGKVLSQESSPGPVLSLMVELPQSRQAEFLAALKEETAPESTGLEKSGVPSPGLARKKDAPAAADEIAGARKSISPQDEPAVRLQLRIRPKK